MLLQSAVSNSPAEASPALSLPARTYTHTRVL